MRIGAKPCHNHSKRCSAQGYAGAAETYCWEIFRIRAANRSLRLSIVVVGSVAFDSLKTPYGKREKILGGAATYFSLSASYFTNVRVVAVVGEDFTSEHEAVMTKRGVDMRGIQRAPGKTFFWAGEYGENVNEAKTLETQLNVFEKFDPQIPAEYYDSDYLFLANIDPVLQTRVRDNMNHVKLVGGDTMNYWIKDHRRNLG